MTVEHPHFQFGVVNSFAAEYPFQKFLLMVIRVSYKFIPIFYWDRLTLILLAFIMNGQDSAHIRGWCLAISEGFDPFLTQFASGSAGELFYLFVPIDRTERARLLVDPIEAPRRLRGR